MALRRAKLRLYSEEDILAGHMQLRSGFNAEKQEVVLQINEGEKAWAHITFELPEFVEVVKKMGELRSMFAEQVHDGLEAGARVEAIVDPRWEVRGQTPGLPKGAALLHLRHPGFGWLSFAIPAHEAIAMGESLAKATK